MTDLKQQAREIYAQTVEKMAVKGEHKANDIRAGNLTPEDERALDAMLAFRAAQPGEELLDAAVNQNDAMRQELANVGNLISDLARALRIDQANDDGTWPDLAGRIRKLVEGIRKPRPDREAVAEREQWETCNCPEPPFDDEVVYDRNLSPRCPRCNVALGGDPMTATERAQAKADEQAGHPPSEDGWREERERLRAALAKARDALMLYDGHVTNPTSAEGWSDDEGYDAYMAARAALSEPQEQGEGKS
ncbi:hypothetical protein OMP43_21685 [Sphingomonas sp. CBMAI 2297]|uniref:hypothetical protein n=1 Tax=Sphingomonas sp. CBMAI 2297 TaxID=2991720 RepID=UPI0024576904|nr:hypothetical protein [Sphingomonas sp. CBMAI 2297]MDH4746642.1 hypothetical protein [Sphingomonas sp. CBMAI 2297]